MSKLQIVVSRHSAFYSPLIGTIAGGFLADEGIEASYGTLPAGRGSLELFRAGEVDVMQASVSSNWHYRERGETDLPVHFAQINQRDGFFLVGRGEEVGFEWTSLHRSRLLADHGRQPLVMLKYAARIQGVQWDQIDVVDAGSPEEMQDAFRAGDGHYIHLQGPAAQETGSIEASVGAAMPEVAFSSLMATREFLETGRAAAFLRAYGKARAWAREAPAGEIAAAEAVYFPGVDGDVLADTIYAYQGLGCWDGDLAISPEHYEQALKVFLQAGAIDQRHPYAAVVQGIVE